MSTEEERNRSMNAKQKAMLQDIPGKVDLYPLMNKRSVKMITYDAPNKIINLSNLGADKYVIKAVANDYTEYEGFNETINETFAGIFGINSLNSKNFSKIVQYNLDAKCLPDMANKCHYVAYEHIPGKTLFLFMAERGGNRNRLVQILKKIFHALYEAYTKIDFVHYDLHLANVIVSTNDEPVIIDYGRSHIKYKGEDYGMEAKDICITNTGNWQVDIIYFLVALIFTLCSSKDISQYLTKEYLQEIKKRETSQFLSYILQDLDLNLAYWNNDDEQRDDIAKISDKIRNFHNQNIEDKDMVIKIAPQYRGDFYSDMGFLLELLAFFPNFQDIMNTYGEMFLLGTEFIPKEIACFGKQAPRNFSDFITLVDRIVK